MILWFHMPVCPNWPVYLYTSVEVVGYHCNRVWEGRFHHISIRISLSVGLIQRWKQLKKQQKHHKLKSEHINYTRLCHMWGEETYYGPPAPIDVEMKKLHTLFIHIFAIIAIKQEKLHRVPSETPWLYSGPHELFWRPPGLLPCCTCLNVLLCPAAAGTHVWAAEINNNKTKIIIRQVVYLKVTYITPYKHIKIIFFLTYT